MAHDLIDTIVTQLCITEPLTREYIKLALSDVMTFDRKQHDYGPENIAAFGEFGVVVRMNDKMARIRKLVGTGAAKNEPISDSYTDMAVYGVIARMCRNGVWPGVGGPGGDGEARPIRADGGTFVEVTGTVLPNGPRIGLVGEYVGRATWGDFVVRFTEPFPASLDREWAFSSLDGETDGITIRRICR